MTDERPHRPSRALLVIASGYAAWVVLVLYYTASVILAQRVLMAGSLLAVGGLVCGMGYLSTLRRRALQQRRDSLQKILEKRRRERGN